MLLPSLSLNNSSSEGILNNEENVATNIATQSLYILPCRQNIHVHPLFHDIYEDHLYTSFGRASKVSHRTGVLFLIDLIK